MNLKTGILALLALTANTVFAQTNQQKDTIYEFTAQQCIDFGIKNNYKVKNAIVDMQIQEQTNRQYTALAYPQINGSLGTNYYPNVAVQSFPNFIAAGTYGVLEKEGVKDGNGNAIKSPTDFGFINAAFGTKWNGNAGVTLSQILFDGQVFVGLQARETALSFSQKNIELTEEAIKANIYKVYYQLVVSKTQIDQLDANIERTQKLLHDAGELYKNGFAEKIDVDRASVQLANLQTEKLRVENTITNGYLGLKLLIGMPINDSLVLTEKITEDQIKKDLLSQQDYQIQDRKDYQYLQLGKKLNEYNVRRYKLSALPSAALNAGYSKIANRDQFNLFQKGDWFTSSYVGLRINVPIFLGMSNDANIKKAQLTLKQTENEIDNLKIAIDNEIAVAKNNFNNAITTLDFQKKNMQLAEQVYNQAKKKYEIGTGSNTDITNAQTDLRVAQSNYITALYNAIIAKVDYVKAIGKL
ncbi:MAG TPA: TolC family protein [Panacibacter sp.]|nr:TolC family protein [Panacibacter sp.]HNP44845.1 TolC family protein [Panacibacter sp.]